jgi:hypothetical protein
MYGNGEKRAGTIEIFLPITVALHKAGINQCVHRISSDLS